MMNHEPTPVPKSTWKWIGIPVIISIVFMGLLYLAIATEPDYMPGQQKKAAGVDVHAKHANAANSTAEDVNNEHSSHSTSEHAQAIAEESDNHQTDHAHSDDSQSHGH